ncbi:hypothetical protein [Mesorhizobium sp. B2-6-2]|uniref:hypothetical protein n=1 Tax=Mesorhizobium sp. B2-6-2 TaxID=2589915 RepID=UPI001126F000|nr:hypothetical protein [Mesorhizobium sp. B2-6-2]TPJ77185.1 hypothetical protein FJ419_16830 [Mesorhizobium sp. B2-6-2]
MNEACPIRGGLVPVLAARLSNGTGFNTSGRFESFLATANNCNSAGTDFGLALSLERGLGGRAGRSMTNHVRKGGDLFEAAMITVMALAVIGIILIIAVGIY